MKYMRQKITTIQDNKPINHLKRRIRYGSKTERCAFCVEHLSYHAHATESVFECIFAQSTFQDKLHFSGDKCLIAGDSPLMVRPVDCGYIYGEPEFPDKGSPCLKQDWAECPYNFNRKGDE